MSCREFTSLFLDAWLAGELPARRQQECAAHVAGCAACCSYLDGYNTVVTCLQRLATDDDEVPEFDADLMQRLLGARRDLDD